MVLKPIHWLFLFRFGLQLTLLRLYCSTAIIAILVSNMSFGRSHLFTLLLIFATTITHKRKVF